VSPPRGACDTCGQTFRLLPTGKVPTHQDPFNPKRQCKGSNLPPEVES
jgi:hypothetical protein